MSEGRVATEEQRRDALRDVLPVLDVHGIGHDAGGSSEIFFGWLTDDDINIQQQILASLSSSSATPYKEVAVFLQREPENQLNTNAVKVVSTMGLDLGYISTKLALPLARIMDINLSTVECFLVADEETSPFSVGVYVGFWGQADNKVATIRLLEQHGFNLFGDATDDQPIEIESVLDDLFNKLDGRDQTTETNACDAIATSLKPYQKQALHWMIAAENDKSLPPFYEEKPDPGGTLYYNSITKSITSTRPDPIRGGILADDMGLGKTLEMIALILTNFRDDQPLAAPIQGYTRPSKAEKSKRLEGYRKGRRMVSSSSGRSLASRHSTTSDCRRKSLEEFIRKRKVRQLRQSISSNPPVNLDRRIDAQAASFEVAQASLEISSTNLDSKETKVKFEVKSECKDVKTSVKLECGDVKREINNEIDACVKIEFKNELTLVKIDAASDFTCETKIEADAVKREELQSSAQNNDCDRISTNERRKLNNGAVAVKTEVKSEFGFTPLDVKTEFKNEMGSVQEDRKTVTECIESETGDKRRISTGDGEGMDQLYQKSSRIPNSALGHHFNNTANEDLNRSRRVTGRNFVLHEISSSDNESDDDDDKNEDDGDNDEESTLPMETPAKRAKIFNSASVFDNSAFSNVAATTTSTLTSETGSDLSEPRMLTDEAELTYNFAVNNLHDEDDVEILSAIVPDEIDVDALPEECIDLDKWSDSETFIDLTSETSPETNLSNSKKISRRKENNTSGTGSGRCLKSESSMLCSPSASLATTCTNNAVASTDASKEVEVASRSEPLAGDKPCSTSIVSGSRPSTSLASSDDDDEFSLPDLAPSVSPLPATTTSARRSMGQTQCTGPRATLIVCPKSTLSNWIHQIDEHVSEHVKLRVLTYHGKARECDSRILAQQDIVLTTYETVASDQKGSETVQKVEWLRIVLDEGHIIRTPSAKKTKAVLALKAERKWVVTGTPIQNRIRDLWPMITFLHIDPLEEIRWWNRIIEAGIERGNTKAFQRVKVLFKRIALRRTKTQKRDGKPILSLPKKTIFTEKIKLSDKERSWYDTLLEKGRILINLILEDGSALANYYKILFIMIRLRQMCCHYFLITKSVMAASEDHAETTNIDTTLEADHQDKDVICRLALRSADEKVCGICLDELEFPTLTRCGHFFCGPCIEGFIISEMGDKDVAECPKCSSRISVDDLSKPKRQQKNAAMARFKDVPWESSSKVDALMSALVELRTKSPTTKSLVVSEFTSFLSMIEIPLKNAKFDFVRFNGSMNMDQRSAAIEAFSDPDPSSPTIILLSLKAGGLGINLTAGSRVFLMEPAWNPAAEDQCFDRCHRIGQKNNVVITKFIVENSIEERMIQVQERKKELIKGVLGKGKKTKKQSQKEKQQARIEDIQTLVDI